jgi:branched-chain amino acid transport system substrate-binding protein
MYGWERFLRLSAPRRVWSRILVVFALLAVTAACSNSTLPRGARVAAGEGAQLQDGGGTGDAVGAQGAATDSGASAGGGIASQGGGATGPGGGGVAGVGGTGRQSAAAGSNAAAASGTSVGVTASSVTISVSAAFSGVYASLTNQIYNNAVVTWQKEVNSNGGIFGRQVKLVQVDNQGSADGAIAACKTAQSNGGFMVFNVTGAFVAEDSCEDQAGVPVLDANPSFMDGGWHNVIGGTLATLFSRAEVSFLKSHYMNAGDKKIGIVYTGDVERYAAEYNSTSAELRAQGVQLVHAEKIAQNQTSFVSEMSRMKSSGAQVVLMYVGLEGAGIIRDARAIGFNPQFYAGPNSGAVSDLGAKSGGPQFQGVMGTRFYATTETPAYANFVAKVRKYNGDSAASSVQDFELATYGMADTLGKMLQLAGPNLTRQSFVAGAKTIDNYENGYLVPFTLKGKPVMAGEYELFPLTCCQSNYTWKTIGPYAEQF